MSFYKKIMLSDEERKKYISDFIPELPALRIKAGFSQEELANVIGVSRQTYGAIERGTQKLTWTTYLSLIFFFDYNTATHDLLRSISGFPKDFMLQLNKPDHINSLDISAMVDESTKNVLQLLDEKAKHAIKTLIMIEYARCTETPGEKIVQAFDGTELTF